MTDHTAHHFDSAKALLQAATEDIAASDPPLTEREAVPLALAGAQVHAALAQAAALRDLTLVIRSNAARTLQVAGGRRVSARTAAALVLTIAAGAGVAYGWPAAALVLLAAVTAAHHERMHP